LLKFPANPVRKGYYSTIYFMIYIDEWAHQKWRAFGMLNIEAFFALAGIILS
jgi:hypothetical protein